MDYLKEFLEFCEYQRSLSKNTVRSYEWDLKQFLKHLKDRSLDITGVKIRDVDSFIISLRKEGRSVKTVNRKVVCLRSFFEWLRRVEVVKENPLDFVKSLKQPKTLPRYLTEDQQKVLLEASKNTHHPNKNGPYMKDRDYLLVVFLLDCGLRIGEVCAIQKGDINLEDGTLRVLGKGQKERMVILSDRLIEAIRERFINGSDFLFFNQWRKHLDTRHAFRIVQEIGERAGIENLHPHLLRHTYATNLRRKGADLLLIKEALGHASVSTTEIYAHLGEKEYKEKLRELIN